MPIFQIFQPSPEEASSSNFPPFIFDHRYRQVLTGPTIINGIRTGTAITAQYTRRQLRIQFVI